MRDLKREHMASFLEKKADHALQKLLFEPLPLVIRKSEEGVSVLEGDS